MADTMKWKVFYRNSDNCFVCWENDYFEAEYKKDAISQKLALLPWWHNYNFDAVVAGERFPEDPIKYKQLDLF